ncbi:MAG TPA: glycosyltransferase family 4 protein [Puia sp.]|nr:glycosyltransferase family 4 protein [Puia sp.]
MKIAHCIFTMFTGGAQMLVIDILNNLHNEGHDVTLIVVNDRWDKTVLDQLDPAVPVHYINRKEGSRNPVPIIKLNHLLRKIRPAVVHCHEPNMANFFIRRKFSCLLTVHDVGIKELYHNKYDTLVAISDSVADDVKQRIGIDIPVAHNGIDISSFDRRDKYDLAPNECIRIVQVSRLVHEKKGQDVLIQALSRLLSKRPEQQASIDFIGDGPSKEYLQALTRELNLDSCICFLGNKDRGWIKKNLSTCHILVQPSRYEGFGLTIVEGIAAGIPAIASDIEGPKEILKDFKRDLLFEKENAEELSNRLEALINLYQEGKMKDFFARIYNKTTDTYSINSTVKGYLGIYTALEKKTDSKIYQEI